MLNIRNRFNSFIKSVEYMKQNLIECQGYSERIERMFGKGMVVALTGQRRVGKSCVMKRIYEKYSQDSHNNVIYIDMEKTAFDKRQSPQICSVNGQNVWQSQCRWYQTSTS